MRRSANRDNPHVPEETRFIPTQTRQTGFGPGKRPRCWTRSPSTRATGGRWSTWGWPTSATTGSTSMCGPAAANWPRRWGSGWTSWSMSAGRCWTRSAPVAACRGRCCAITRPTCVCPEHIQQAEWERRMKQPQGYPVTPGGEPVAFLEGERVPYGIRCHNAWRKPKSGGRGPSLERLLKQMLDQLRGPGAGRGADGRSARLPEEGQLPGAGRAGRCSRQDPAAPSQRGGGPAATGHRGHPHALRRVRRGAFRREARDALPPLPRHAGPMAGPGGQRQPVGQADQEAADDPAGGQGAHGPDHHGRPAGLRDRLQGPGSRVEGQRAGLLADVGDGHRRGRPGRRGDAEHPAPAGQLRPARRPCRAALAGRPGARLRPQHAPRPVFLRQAPGDDRGRGARPGRVAGQPRCPGPAPLRHRLRGGRAGAGRAGWSSTSNPAATSIRRPSMP